VKIIDVIENKSILVEKELILEGGNFGVIYEQNEALFSVSYKPKGMEITAGNYIGTIPINNKVALNVQPKIGIKNFFYLLRVSRRDIKSFPKFLRGYAQSDDYNNLIDLFTITFLRHMEVVEQEGIYRDYVRRERNSSTPKGKILFKDNMYQNTFRNVNYKIVHAFQELDRDILANQVIKYTIEYLIQYYRFFGRTQKRFLKRLMYYRDMFSRVSYVSWIRDMSQSDFNDLKKRIPQIRSYYLDVLEICFLIIKKASFQFESRKKDVTNKLLPSIYINMEDVFEQYLLNSLKGKTAIPSIRIYKGNKELFADKETPTIEPDVVVEENKRVVCLADAKYKASSATREDIFQMISYLVSYECDVGVFILPRGSNKKIDYLGNIQGKLIYIYRINLDHDDVDKLKIEEEELYRFLTMNTTEKELFYKQQTENFQLDMFEVDSISE
jgi:5-methylcytosine-specific restriction enzyme subunit McrC